jgi:hypothetical protein
VTGALTFAPPNPNVVGTKHGSGRLRRLDPHSDELGIEASRVVILRDAVGRIMVCAWGRKAVVGKLNISPQADAVRHLFMGLEKKARKIKSCWHCDSALSTLKLANQGHLSGNHKPNCPFEEVARAAEECIKARYDEQQIREHETRLSEKVAALLEANAQVSPCPLCDSGFAGEHAYECPFHDLSSGAFQSQEAPKAGGQKHTVPTTSGNGETVPKS